LITACDRLLHLLNSVGYGKGAGGYAELGHRQSAVAAAGVCIRGERLDRYLAGAGPQVFGEPGDHVVGAAVRD